MEWPSTIKPERNITNTRSESATVLLLLLALPNTPGPTSSNNR